MSKSHLISIAPMIDCTDRYYRYLMRLITKHTWLYTEMITTYQIRSADSESLLSFDECEHPLAIQLAGNEPNELAECAYLAEQLGYDEVNFNVGCPSKQVQAGGFGVCLMKQPQLVADCVAAMQKKVTIPVTVKTRIGVDDCDSYQELHHFINTVSEAGCDMFILHARKAWLKGLSPKKNRSVPPLKYDIVKKIKNDFPSLTIIINGGLKELMQFNEQLQCCDGIMVGREAYSNPYLFSQVDKTYFNDDHPILSREEIAELYFDYIKKQGVSQSKFKLLFKHLLGLYAGQPGAKKWRGSLTGVEL